MALQTSFLTSTTVSPSLSIAPSPSTITTSPEFDDEPLYLLLAISLPLVAILLVLLAVITIIIAVFKCKNRPCLKWTLPNDEENSKGSLNMSPVNGQHADINDQFHSSDTPQYNRQLGQTVNRKPSLLDVEEGIYNGGSMASAHSGISALSESSISCPSPTVSSYHGEEDRILPGDDSTEFYESPYNRPIAFNAPSISVETAPFTPEGSKLIQQYSFFHDAGQHFYGNHGYVDVNSSLNVIPAPKIGRLDSNYSLYSELIHDRQNKRWTHEHESHGNHCHRKHHSLSSQHSHSDHSEQMSTGGYHSEYNLKHRHNQSRSHPYHHGNDHHHHRHRHGHDHHKLRDQSRSRSRFRSPKVSRSECHYQPELMAPRSGQQYLSHHTLPNSGRSAIPMRASHSDDFVRSSGKHGHHFFEGQEPVDNLPNLSLNDTLMDTTPPLIAPVQSQSRVSSLRAQSSQLQPTTRKRSRSSRSHSPSSSGNDSSNQHSRNRSMIKDSRCTTRSGNIGAVSNMHPNFRGSTTCLPRSASTLLTCHQHKAFNNDSDSMPPEGSNLHSFFPHNSTLISSLTSNSDGLKFEDKSNDFILEIPQGAVPESQTVTIDVGVALFGPFQFPEGLRPVSPVFWVCVRDQPDFIFSKPVSLTIPHFLNLENDKEIQSLGLTFLKAGHHLNQRRRYYFNETGGKSTFKPLQRYGNFETTHFCSLCIACRDTPEVLKRATFCITAVIPNSTIPVGKKTYAFFFITFLNLKTCLKKVDEIVAKKNLKKYNTTREEFEFEEDDELTDPMLTVDISQPKHGKIGFAGNKKIHRSKVDIFTRNLTEEELKEQESEDFYPPKFRLFLSCSQKDATLSDGKIEFRGTTSDPEFDIYLDVPNPDIIVNIESPVMDQEKPLSPEDLFQVKSKLMRVAVRWKHIGLALGLRSDTLDCVEANHRKTEDCLTAMIKVWLKRAFPVEEKGVPTLKRLREAVQNPAGGNNPVAASELLHNWTFQTIC